MGFTGYFRKDAGVDGDAQRIGQLVWMIFLKIFDDREQEYELLENDYRSPIPDRLRWRYWAANPEGLTGDRLLDFVTTDLFPSLKELPLDTKRDRRGLVVRQVFRDAYNYMKNGTLMRQVVNKITHLTQYVCTDKDGLSCQIMLLASPVA
uniref:type I restriction-modification system subunit M N-terminal domain-containing protein n=1 Tax=Candidatus Oscillochloris fontis TaxID=2496868 RepID=UPI001291A9C9